MKLIHRHFYFGAVFGSGSGFGPGSLFFQYSLSKHIQYPFAKGLVEGGETQWVESNRHILDVSIS